MGLGALVFARGLARSTCPGPTGRARARTVRTRRSARFQAWVLVGSFLATSASADVRLPRIFSDGVVLQQRTRVAIFGFAAPGETVRVRASFGVTSEPASADAEGRWKTWIETPAAGGPYTLDVRGRNSVRVSDVWIGEVWLASGQSNMEMPLGPIPGLWEGAHGFEREVATAEDARIRLFTVENQISVGPRDDVGGSWTRATPDEAARFSATAWFFARKLRAELGVPIGIVASDVGGSVIEAWISGITLARDPDYADDVARLEREVRAPAKVAAERARAVEAWLAGIEESDRGLSRGYASANYDDSLWKDVSVPGELDGAFSLHDGVFWLRRTFETPGGLIGRDAELSLGRIDDYDAVFLDGQYVGGTVQRNAIRAQRTYTIDKRLMTVGRHALAVRIYDLAGTAGVLGRPADVRLRSGKHELVLGGTWKAAIGAPAAMLAPPSEAVDFNASTPSSIYNAMIAPLTPFRFAGVVWYQGESNRRRAAQYTRLFPELIEDWRARFAVEFLPFYFVQLAPYGIDGDQGEMAELREAQRRALALPATGLVATNDVGDARDVHPRSKREVGERLAAWALARTYGRERPCAGPLVDAARSGPRAGTNEFEVAFEHAERLHFTGPARGVFELTDGTSGWVEADARLEDGRIVLSAERCARPIAARLDSARGERAHLVNEAGLPAAAFVIGDAPWITTRTTRAPRALRKNDEFVLAPPLTEAGQGLPLANGLLGAFVWIDGGKLRLAVGCSGFWDPRRPPIVRQPDWNAADLRTRIASEDLDGSLARYLAPFEAIRAPSPLPLGEIEIPLAGREPRSYGLDVARAEAGIPLDRGFVGAFVSAARPLVVLRVDGLTLAEARPADYVLRLFGGAAVHDQNGLAGEARALDASSMGVAIEAVERETGIEIAIAIASQDEDASPSELARTRAREALEIGYSRLLGEHLLTWSSLQGPARIALGERAVEDVYAFARYVMLSTQRRGAPLAGSQGPWITSLEPPAHARGLELDSIAYELYGAYAPTGSFECGQGALEFLSRRSAGFREFARDFHGVRGLVVPGRAAFDGSPVGVDGPAAFGVAATAWTIVLGARHARFTGDLEFARRVVAPLCREAAGALVELAPAGAGGLRRPLLSTSPGFGGGELRGFLHGASNHDLALLRAAFLDLAALERALGTNDDALAWERVAAEVVDLAQERTGPLMLSEHLRYRASDAGLAHAAAIWPLANLSIEGGVRERAIVDDTLDQILAQGTGTWNGALFAQAAALAARAGRPETAHRLLLEFERGFPRQNGLASIDDLSGEGLSATRLGGFSIAGNLLAMAAVHEMLLQSWGGVVRVFPAASIVWADASFDELRAEGGFVVSARRAGGITRSVTVRATVPARLRLRDPFEGREPKWSKGRVARDGRDWVVDLGRDEELVGIVPEKR